MGRVKISNKVETTIHTQSLEIEVPEGQVVHIGDKRIFFNNGSFITLFQEPLQKILSEIDLNKNELKVLLYAIANCQTNNVVETNSTIVGKMIGVNDGNVRRAFFSLRKKNIIVEEDGQSLLNLTKFSKVNYRLAYAGKHNDFAKVVDSHPLILDDEGKPIINPRKHIKKPRLEILPPNPN